MLKVLIPCMPSPEALLPYLREMHSKREYVNRGPLVRELEAQIGAMHGLLGTTVAVSNGTVALEQALRALELPPQSLVLVPSVTFAATGLAVLSAGLQPLVCDVDPITWQLSIDTAEKWFYSGLSIEAPWRRIRAVMPVAAFGHPVDGEAWAAFGKKHNISVVIDAAGCLTTQKPPKSAHVATCYSMHATKFVGAGEGGLVCTVDVDTTIQIRDRINFGEGGTNGKLSEYHAAVGLASMNADFRHTKRCAAAAVFGYYLRHMPPHPDLIIPPFVEDRTIFPVVLPSAETARRAVQALCADRIETKRWYAPFLHERTDFQAYRASGETFIVANYLSAKLVGLPFHSFMSEPDVMHVCKVIKEALK